MRASPREHLLSLVAKAAQQGFSAGNILVTLDPLGMVAIDDAQDTSSLLGLGDYHFYRIGGGAEDMTDLLNFGYGW